MMGSEANVQDNFVVVVQSIPNVNVQGKNIPGQDIHESDALKEENNSTVLLCVEGQVNGIQGS